MTEEHDFNIYPEKLTHSKYLQTGKILIWISAVLIVISFATGIYTKVLFINPPIEDIQSYAVFFSIQAIIGWISLIITVSIILIFR